MLQRLNKHYAQISFITICAVYLLILVGGIVRSTGAGMGCPDWPKCFGQYIPPTSVDQLPIDYKDQYSEIRHEKNVRLAGMLESLGFKELAVRITTDESIREEADFNATKTWIEYINRLIGAVIGLLILLTVISSIAYFNTKPAVFWASFTSLILVGFQGWIGSIVVSTNLLPGMITFHMLLALLIVGVLIYGYYKSVDEEEANSNLDFHWLRIRILLIVSMVLYLVQIALGTQVREVIDQIAVVLPGARDQWIGNLGMEFYIHRSYSLLILGVHLYLGYLLINGLNDYQGKAVFLIKSIIGLIILEIATGALMAYFAIPSILQPIHLLVASVIFGTQFYLFCVSTESQQQRVKVT